MFLCMRVYSLIICCVFVGELVFKSGQELTYLLAFVFISQLKTFFHVYWRACVYFKASLCMFVGEF